MDIPQKKNIPFIKYIKPAITLTLAVLVLFVWMNPKASSDEVTLIEENLVYAKVIRGNMLKTVRAPGSLVPVDLRWIAVQSSGRIEKVLKLPGARVSSDTVILQLTNPELSQNLDNAKLALDVAQSEQTVLQKRLINQQLSQKALLAQVESDYVNARFRTEANQALSGKNIVSKLDLKESELQEKQLKIRFDIEKERLDNLPDLHKAELDAQNARVNQAKRQLDLLQQLMDDMQVKAGFDGILQEVLVEQGQQIQSGQRLARVAREDNLKTELRVQESQVKDVALGQEVTIMAGGNKAQGIVSRIEPAVQNGVVVVDVLFKDSLLVGARPDLRVEGTIKIAALEDVLTLKRPVFSQENSRINLYQVNRETNLAVKTLVTLGVASLDQIQISDGLNAGDEVIISDLRQYNDSDTLSIQ